MEEYRANLLERSGSSKDSPKWRSVSLPPLQALDQWFLPIVDCRFVRFSVKAENSVATPDISLQKFKIWRPQNLYPSKRSSLRWKTTHKTTHTEDDGSDIRRHTPDGGAWPEFLPSLLLRHFDAWSPDWRVCDKLTIALCSESAADAEADEFWYIIHDASCTPPPLMEPPTPLLYGEIEHIKLQLFRTIPQMGRACEGEMWCCLPRICMI